TKINLTETPVHFIPLRAGLRLFASHCLIFHKEGVCYDTRLLKKTSVAARNLFMCWFNYHGFWCGLFYPSCSWHQSHLQRTLCNGSNFWPDSGTNHHHHEFSFCGAADRHLKKKISMVSAAAISRCCVIWHND